MAKTSKKTKKNLTPEENSPATADQELPAVTDPPVETGGNGGEAPVSPKPPPATPARRRSVSPYVQHRPGPMESQPPRRPRSPSRAFSRPLEPSRGPSILSRGFGSQRDGSTQEDSQDGDALLSRTVRGLENRHVTIDEERRSESDAGLRRTRELFVKKDQRLAEEMQAGIYEEELQYSDPPPWSALHPRNNPSNRAESSRKAREREGRRSPREESQARRDSSKDKGADRERRERHASLELQESILQRKYQDIFREKNRERNAILEDLVGNIEILSANITASANNAVEAVKQAAAVAKQTEQQAGELARVRERLNKLLGRTSTPTMSGDAASDLARHQAELRASQKEAHSLARTLSENARLRKSGLPTGADGTLRPDGDDHLGAKRFAPNHSDARRRQKDDDILYDPDGERLILKDRPGRPKRPVRYHGFASVESQHMVRAGSQDPDEDESSEEDDLQSRYGKNSALMLKGNDRISMMVRRALVSKAVAERRGELPSHLKKGLKLDLPEAYSGSSDVTAFEEWLTKLLAWFQLYQTDVLTYDQNATRLHILTIALKERALSFHRGKREEYEDRGRTYDFRHAIFDLRDRFLHRHSALTAQARYKAMTQGSKSVQALYEDLLDEADRLVEFPSRYELRMRFVQALRKDIRTEVHKRGLRAEDMPLKTLLAAACDIEESEAYEKRFAQLTQPERPSGHGSSKAEPSRDRHTTRDESSRRSRSERGRERSRSSRHDRSRSRPPETNRETRKDSGREVKPEKRTDEKSSSKTKPSDERKKDVTCFTCNEKGHISPDCPKNANAIKARAVHYERDESSDEDYSSRSHSSEDEYTSENYVGTGHSEPDWEETAGEQSYPDSDSDSRSGYRTLRSGAIRIERAEYARKVGKPPKGEKPSVESNIARRKAEPSGQQPPRPAASQQCIEVMINIGGLEAKALIDPGSTTDMVSPDFAKVAKLTPIALEDPMPLQLALTGSRSKVNFGTWPEISLGPIREKRYFDITSLDGYDAILGTPFCWENGISPIFREGGYLDINGEKFDPPRPTRPAIVSRSRGRKPFRDEPGPKPEKPEGGGQSFRA